MPARRPRRGDGTYADLLNTGSLSPFVATWSSTAMTKRERPINKEELGAMVTEERLRVLETVTDHPALFEEANRVLKMNEYADPQIAEAFQIVHKGDGSARSFPYHFAGVVAKTGSDVLTPPAAAIILRVTKSVMPDGLASLTTVTPLNQ